MHRDPGAAAMGACIRAGGDTGPYDVLPIPSWGGTTSARLPSHLHTPSSTAPRRGGCPHPPAVNAPVGAGITRPPVLHLPLPNISLQNLWNFVNFRLDPYS